MSISRLYSGEWDSIYFKNTSRNCRPILSTGRKHWRRKGLALTDSVYKSSCSGCLNVSLLNNQQISNGSKCIDSDRKRFNRYSQKSTLEKGNLAIIGIICNMESCLELSVSEAPEIASFQLGRSCFTSVPDLKRAIFFIATNFFWTRQTLQERFVQDPFLGKKCCVSGRSVMYCLKRMWTLPRLSHTVHEEPLIDFSA